MDSYHDTDNKTQTTGAEPESSVKLSAKRIPLAFIAAALFLAVFLTVVEFAALLAGLELRTFAQMIKGTCLWLIVPCIVLSALNHLAAAYIAQKSADACAADDAPEARQRSLRAFHWIRRLMLFISVLIVLALSFFRSLFYLFTDEMVSEEMTADGYIKGTSASLFSESHDIYYTPTAGIFRKPFEGWSDEQLLVKMREKYGQNIEFAERQANGYCVFRIPDALEAGNYIYFHVSTSYTMENNAPFQILLSEACHFWPNQNRAVTLSGDGSVSLEDGRDTGEEIEDLRDMQEFFYITCYPSKLDITACAADLTDWLEFVKKTGQYPLDPENEAESFLENYHISRYFIGYPYGENGRYFNFYLPQSCFMDEDTWGVKYDKLLYQLSDAYEPYIEAWNTKTASESIPETETRSREEADALFMNTYDGTYEKECEIKDGAVRYRMVVRDAALGSRLYSLLKSTDGGNSWQMSSSDPFDQQLGMGIDFTFLDENLGFATLAHNGGDEADLYITEDGGDTYQNVILEGYTITLEDGYTYNPYDFPRMPYAQDGLLYVLCGQGADGDYNGGDSAGLALYESADGGHTFTFVEIKSR